MLDILKENNFKFNKKFGQNFIFDTNLLSAIVNDANVDENTNVLEIGPGAGTLTKKLCEKAKKVVSYEIDTNLAPILAENLKDCNNSEIVFGDILKQNIKDIESKFDDNYVMVANLPYYITTPIIFKFLEEATKLRSITIMVQKEVAERICAKHNTEEYGAITVQINAIADAKITRIVKRNMFKPAPNVDSAVVRIDFNFDKYNIENLSLFKRLVTSAFAMRRKTLANNLKSSFSLDAETIEKLLNSVDLKKDVRGEALSVEEFVKLSNQLNKILK